MSYVSYTIQGGPKSKPLTNDQKIVLNCISGLLFGPPCTCLSSV